MLVGTENREKERWIESDKRWIISGVVRVDRSSRDGAHEQGKRGVGLLCG